MKALGRFVLLCVLLAVVVAISFWRKPLWTARQGTHFGLFLSRIQSNYVLTPEGRVHYYEAEPRIPGGGIPLVLVHGFADRGESWAPMLKRLKRAGFHVYAPDLLGSGRSPRPEDGDYSIAGQTRFVYDFIQSLGLQKTDVGGWSMGGWIVLDLAKAHPDVVDRVVVFDGAGLTPGPGEDFTKYHLDNADDVQNWFHTMEPEAKPLPANVLRDFMQELQDNRDILLKGLKAMTVNPPYVDHDLPAMQEPLLLLWGSRDGLIPLTQGYRMHALDPRSELDVVEGCGHLAPARCAARVAPAVADFLKSNPAPEGQVRTLANMAKSAGQ